MASIDIEAMTVAELIEHREVVNKLIITKQEQAKQALRQSFIEEARKAGLTITDLFGNLAVSSAAAPVEQATKAPRAPKEPKEGDSRSGPVEKVYRDPDNHNNLWSGRGRTPTWVAAAEAKYGSRHALRIRVQDGIEDAAVPMDDPYVVAQKAAKEAVGADSDE